jgi:large subunit ribosomal protein L5
MAYVPSLKKIYLEKVVPDLMKNRGYSNIHEVPCIQKVVINSGFDATADKHSIEERVKELTRISGQKPVITKARLSISNFKLREGMPIGVKVTLRGASMYDFLYKMIAIALPGIRDFRGIGNKMDGNGNYTLGITDHTIFPEVMNDGTKHSLGMDITIVTTAKTDEEGHELLQLMGMPFRKRSN